MGSCNARRCAATAPLRPFRTQEPSCPIPPLPTTLLLSDRHSCALVDAEGSVEWLSFPRFDSPSVFGRLLGPDAGHWRIAPTGEWTSTRRYVDRTLVLETTFTTPTGVLVLTDLLALGPDNGGHRLGIGVPHLFVRRLACTLGPGRGRDFVRAAA